ncbi:MAG: hypothetical protein IJH37_13065 [Clostridia bacterium]|nr:hypothetical protein [Clostridia bacterium]
MSRTQIFPAVLMMLDIGAAVMCAVSGDWKKTVYWTAAAVLSYTVTF